MKRMSFNIISCLLLAFALFAVSCGKDGATGPAGAQGPAGPAGPGGPAGPAGPAGTANVIYSDWLDVTYEPDTVHNPDGTIDTLQYIATIAETKLDLDMLSTGEIKVYLNGFSAADPTVIPLPYFSIYSGLTIDPIFYLNTIQLTSNGDISTVTQAGVKYQQYRYILIPGGTPARKAPIDWNNYKAVQLYLGLKD
ncbi:hypothetical protein [Chitinophaga sp. CF418]|uniref:hypothetical protein n=1 Tax=Chitinophaga sp. CF418 TaxID=1855287 RepID=UPI0009152930|nr:hypothetical protein [Chitinophaga sp. CF418]SHM43231.1 hypothetical protein SAMN05216311_102168 [Chitinophaga sp. CF418]